MPESEKRKLTEKQKRFVDYYIITHGNAAEAARRAGYSEEKARIIGAQNLTKLNIKEAIDAALAEEDEKRRLSRKEALEILTSIARGEVRENAVVVDERENEKGDEEKDAKGRKSKNIRKMQNSTSNRDRLRAIELVARLNNWEREVMKESAAKDVADEQAIQIYLPDNGRGDRDD